MIKTLDRYIIKKFVLNFIFWVIAFVFIAVIIDVGENIDRLIKSEAPLWDIITRYYFPFCVFFGNLLSPFLVFLSIIWVASNMAQKSEFIAILSGGISFNRMIRPFMLVSLCFAILAYFGVSYVVPMTNKIKYDFESEYTRGSHNFGKNIHRELQEDTLYYFSHIRSHDNVGYDFAKEVWSDGELKEKLTATRAEFLPDTGLWKMKNLMERKFLEGDRESIEETRDSLVFVNMRIPDFGEPDEVMRNMNNSEIQAYYEKEKAKGSSKLALIQVEVNSRPAIAFSILILAFIGISIAARKIRGGMGIHLLLAVILAAGFLFSSRLSSVAAMNVGFPANIAVWIPNLLFLLLGIWIYKRAPK